MTPVQIHQAEPNELEIVSAILTEAAAWLNERFMPLWTDHELDSEAIQGHVAAGLYWLAHVDGEPAGCVRYQLEDVRFWPDATLGEAAYIHRLAVKRAYAGGGVSTALIDWAKAHALDKGHKYLRLDCDASRPALHTFFERHGFKRVEEREVGANTVVLYECDLHAPRDAD